MRLGGPSASHRFHDRTLTVHVDGSARGGPRKGGIGILFLWPDEAGAEQRDPHVLPATAGATISQMELEAPSEALRIALRGRTPFDLADFDRILILSDSRYVCENLRNAQLGWPKTGWRTKAGGAVLNERDWRTLTKLIEKMYRERRIRVIVEWERGKVSANAKAVDKLAKQSSASATLSRARPTNVRRKLTRSSVDPGSVRLEGQQLRVRIIDARHLSGREGLYRYEVREASSPYDAKVDLAQSDQPLGPGHTYDVVMNADQGNPRIVAIVAEVQEDLTPYRDALRTLGRAVSATDVATEVKRATGVAHAFGGKATTRQTRRAGTGAGDARHDWSPAVLLRASATERALIAGTYDYLDAAASVEACAAAQQHHQLACLLSQGPL